MSAKKTIIVILIVLFILGVKIGVILNKVEAASENPNYIIWWPARVHDNELNEYFSAVGGVQFLNYNRANSFNHLQTKFNAMIEKHKPDIILLLFDWKDIQPLKLTSQGYNAHPEGTRNITDVADENLNMDYFDDIVMMANKNGIKVILYPNLSAYGGPVAYPFTYYSRTGWFWKRPDWTTPGMCADGNGNFTFNNKGCADPAGDAMRYPSLTPEIFQNLSSLKHYLKPSYAYYQYIAHQAGYDTMGETGLNSDGTLKESKWNDVYTLDGKVDTGAGTWNVTEGPDLVYNGYDIVITEGDGTQRNVNTPIPSFSSDAYRNLTKAIVKKIAEHYKNNEIYAYNLFQEPSYAILRNNINYCFTHDVTAPSSNFKKDEPPYAGNNCLYEVDYSAAEKNRYNYWRKNIANPRLSTVTSVPFPLYDIDINKEDGNIDYPAHADAENYIEFRKWNLASFLKNLSDGIKEADPNAKIAASLYAAYYPNVDDIKRAAKIDKDKDDFYGVWLNSAVGPKQILQQVKPNIIFLEPPSGNTTILEPFTHPDTGQTIDLKIQLNNLINSTVENFYQIQQTELLFYYPADADNTYIESFQRHTAQDAQIRSFFISRGFKNVYFPALNDTTDTGGYATWMSNDCQTCNFRAGYSNPATTTLIGDLNSSSTLDAGDIGVMRNILFLQSSNVVPIYQERADYNQDDSNDLVDLVRQIEFVESAK